MSRTVKKTMMQEDAPQMQHNLKELSANWKWETIEGDAATGFGIKVERISDNEIAIRNFLNLDGESIIAQVEGDKLTFSGEMAGGNLLIKNGKGVITNGWLTITLTYNTYDGDTTEYQKVILSKGEAL